MTFQIVARTYDDPDVVRMVDEVQDAYRLLYGGPDRAAVDPAEFTEPAGLFLVGLLDGDPVATGGWRRLDGPEDRNDGAGGDDDYGLNAEIKRMYVRVRARRLGLSRLLLAELERTASAAGVRRLVLSTGRRQPEAIALYTGCGYTPTRPFGHYAAEPGAVFLAKTLTGQ